LCLKRKNTINQAIINQICGVVNFEQSSSSPNNPTKKPVLSKN